MEGLRDSHSSKEQAFTELQGQVSELHTRLSTAQAEAISAAAAAATAIANASAAAATRGRTAKTTSSAAGGTMGYDDDDGTVEGSQYDAEGAEDHDHDAAFDINDFISVPPVDAETQAGAAYSEFFNMGTQFPYPYDPDWKPHHAAVQTSAADFLYPTEHYLEVLFRDFVVESQSHIPQGNRAILRSSRPQDTTNEPKSRLALIAVAMAWCRGPAYASVDAY
jgi:hypothetical protein